MRVFLFLFMIHSIYSEAQFNAIEYDILEEGKIYFDSDKYNLDTGDKVILDSIINFQHTDSLYYYLDAHTDDIGSPEYNEALSKDRLQSVAAYLFDGLIDKNRVFMGYHGELKPANTNENEEGRRLNRRVEIVVLKKRPLKKLWIKVIDSKTQKVIEAEISVTTQFFTNSLKHKMDSLTSINVPIDDNLKIKAESDNYLGKSLRLKPKVLSKVDTVLLKMVKIEEGSSFVLEGMLFRPNLCIMVPRSLPVLEDFYKTLKRNENVCVEIEGHINLPNNPPVERTHNYFDLSVSRALVVFDSLSLWGIDKRRMLARGYGNYNMIYPKTNSEREMAMNRRVEIAVVNCDSISKLENHEVINPRIHGYIMLDRLFNKEKLSLAMGSMPTEYREKILSNLRLMKEKGIEPEGKTYREIHQFMPF